MSDPDAHPEPDLDVVRRTLLAKAEQLQSDIDELTRSHRGTGDIGFGKRVGDGTSMAVDRLSAVHAHSRLMAMLDEVRRALDALERGTYGRCAVCGDPVPQPRLEARPWATRCVRCAASAGPR